MSNIILLYPLAFFLLFLFIKNKRKNIVYTCLILMYLASAISGAYVYNTQYHFFDIQLSVSAIIYHLFFTIVILIQFRRYEYYQHIKMPKIHSVTSFRIFTYVIIFICLSSIIHSLQNVNLDVVINDIRSLRQSVNQDKEISMMGYLAFFGNKYCFVALALAFYYGIYEPHKKTLIFILLFCSFSSVISGLQVAAREYVLKYIYMSFIVYAFCKNQLEHSWKHSLKTLFFVISGSGILIFFIISILRFQFSDNYDSISSDNTIINSILSYTGQGWAHFSEIFNTFQEPKTTVGAIHFPFFATEIISNKNLNDMISVDINLNQFSTAMGSWMVDGGVYFTAFIALLFTFLFRFVSILKYNIFTLIYVLWAYDFIFSYMFFFNETINTSRLLSLFFVIAIDIHERHSANRIKYTNVRLKRANRFLK